MEYLINAILQNTWIRTTINIFIQASSLYAIFACQNPPLLLVACVSLGLCMVNGIELVHECLHMSAFKSKTLNRLVGILLSAPIFISYSAYRKKHLWHHAKIGTPEDSEFFRHTTIPNTRIQLMKKLFNPKDLILKIKEYYTSNCTTLFIPHASHIFTLIELGINFALLTLLLHPLVLNGNPVPLGAYFLTLFLVFNPIHHLVEFPEHAFCDINSRLVSENTRSITGGFISTWFTNYNNLHVEHHQYPNVRFYDLIEIHRNKRKNLKFTSDSFAQFYKEFWNSLKAKR